MEFNFNRNLFGLDDSRQAFLDVYDVFYQLDCIFSCSYQYLDDIKLNKMLDSKFLNKANLTLDIIKILDNKRHQLADGVESYFSYVLWDEEERSLLNSISAKINMLKLYNVDLSSDVRVLKDGFLVQIGFYVDSINNRLKKTEEIWKNDNFYKYKKVVENIIKDLQKVVDNLFLELDDCEQFEK